MTMALWHDLQPVVNWLEEQIEIASAAVGDHSDRADYDAMHQAAAACYELRRVQAKLAEYRDPGCKECHGEGRVETGVYAPSGTAEMMDCPCCVDGVLYGVKVDCESEEIVF